MANRKILEVDEAIISKIFLIRGKKVMVDRDLADLYDLPTKRLNQQVKRNLNRFPVDFMFQLTIAEKEELVTICDRFKTLKLEQLENQVTKNNEDIQMIFSALKQLLIPPEQSNRRRIGFRRANEKQSEL